MQHLYKCISKNNNDENTLINYESNIIDKLDNNKFVIKIESFE